MIMEKFFYRYIFSYQDQQNFDRDTLDGSVICFYEKRKKRLLCLFFIFFFLLFAVDFVSKEYVNRHLKRDIEQGIPLKDNEYRDFLVPERKYFVLKVVDVIPNYFSLMYVRNFDIGFSLLRHLKGFFTEKSFFYFVVGLQSTVLMLLVLLLSSYLFDLFVPFVFIFSGGFSNIFDRAFRGYVVDFFRINFPDSLAIFEPWPIFNFADIFISIGAFYLIYEYFFSKNAVFFFEKEKY